MLKSKARTENPALSESLSSMKRSAMSLTELLVGLAILTILAGLTHLSPDLYKRTSRREAERVYAQLSNLMLEADRTHTSFKLEVEPKRLKIIWQKLDQSAAKSTEYFDAGPNCTYSLEAPDKTLMYSHVKNAYTRGETLTVSGKGSPHYVVIATIGSRIRLSDTHP